MSEEATVKMLPETGELEVNEPNFIGPPIKYSMSGTRIEAGGDPNKPVYDANVDIVNIMPYLLERVLYMLISTQNCPMIDQFCDEQGIKVKDLEDAFNKFIDTCNLFTGPEARSTISSAAKDSGYADVPKEQKLVIEAALGRLIMATYWFGIRARTEKSSLPTIPPAYDRWYIIHKEVLAALDGVVTPYAQKVIAKFGEKLNDDCAPLDEEYNG